MEISWLGHSCFRLKGKEVSLLTDPFDPSLGYPWGQPQAQIVTVSHGHPGHSFVQGVQGQPKVIKGPGEYEVGQVFICGIPSFHDPETGAKLGKNTIFVLELDGIRICHLGDLGHSLSSQQVDDIGHIDVLLLPVGGVTTLGATTAAQTMRQLQPLVVIPMHYKTPALRRELEPLEGFAREVGLKQPEAQPRLSLTRASLPAEMQVVVLGYPMS